MRSTSGNPDAKEKNPDDDFMIDDVESIEAQLYAKLYYSSKTYAEPNTESIDNLNTIQENNPAEIADVNTMNNVNDNINTNKPSTNTTSPAKSVPQPIIVPENSEPPVVSPKTSQINIEANARLPETPKTAKQLKKQLKMETRKKLQLEKRKKKAKQKERKQMQKLRKTRAEYIAIIGNPNAKTNSKAQTKNLRKLTMQNRQNEKGRKRYSLRPTIHVSDPCVMVENTHFFFESGTTNESEDEKEQEEEQNSPEPSVNNTSLKEPLEIIEILSSSSSDSESEEESEAEVKKVDSPKAPAKKTKKTFEDLEDSSDSDSDGSVLEVPVPPKPIPLLIDLDESGKESDDEQDAKSKKDRENKITGRENDAESRPNNVIEPPEPFVDSDDTFLNDEAFPEKKGENWEVDNRSFIGTKSVVTDDNAMDSSIVLNCEGLENSVIILDKVSNQDELVVEIEKSVQKDASTPMASKRKRNFYQISEGDEDQRLSSQQPFKKKKDFYDNSWGGENFELAEVLRQMPKDRKRWSIIPADMAGKSPRRYWKKRCNNCQNEGHESRFCREPKKVTCCHMCGMIGHREIRCPGKMCLTCGQKQFSYTAMCNQCRKMHCTICKSTGHNYLTCPDHWRQYHSTTNTQDATLPRNPSTVMKSKTRQYCCNCGKKGHDSYVCTSYRWSQSFKTPAYVTRYKNNINQN